jgi:hypothetical protein
MTLAATGDAPVAPIRKPITVRAAPRREPPFDDEARHLHLVGPLDRALPFDVATATARLARLPPVIEPIDHGGLPEPTAWARRMLIAVLEARAGRRSPQQLSFWLSRGVQAGLVRDLPRTTAQHGAIAPPTRVRSVHVCEPAPGVAEIAAVVQVGNRCRAVAARLEGRDGGWRCVRLQIG